MLYNFYTSDTAVMFITVFINIILSVAVIFLERKQLSSTYAWLLFLWVLPVVGFIFYFLFSQKFSSKRVYRLYQSENKRFNEKLNMQREAIARAQEEGDERYNPYLDNIAYHVNVSEALYTDGNVVEVFDDGTRLFEQMLKDMEAAQSSINVEFYILRNKGIGKRFFDTLEKKAREGVHVRVIYDELGSSTLSYGHRHRLRRAGGKIGAFLPSRLSFISKYVQLRVNYRLHRKVVVIDGKIGYIGGFNVGDEYLGLSKKFHYWRDTHLRVQGPAVTELQWRFVSDWSTTGQEAVDLKHPEKYAYLFPKPDTGGVCGETGIQIVASGPDTVNQVIKQGYLKMIADAKHRVRIMSPYVVLDQSVEEALRIALNSGIEVEMMIPDIADHPFIYPTTLSYAGGLVEYGAKVYKYLPGFVHSKVMTIDDTLSVVGSCNFDIRSFALNFECSAFLYDPKINRVLNEQFDRDIALSEEYTLEKYRNRGIVLKVRESISRLLAPLL